MRILITNDDGIRGEGLRCLAEFASAIGDAVVVAPLEEQSACAQSITIRRPIDFQRTDLLSDLPVEAYTVDSAPADCVRIATDRLGKFDLVFSGINNGYNTGHYVSYSGTCSAMFEAGYEGMKAIGFSTFAYKMKEAGAELPRIWEYIAMNRLLERCPLLNINIPPAFRDFRITRQKPEYLNDTFVKTEDGRYLAKLNLDRWMNEEHDVTFDMEAFFAGYCSITPMQVNRTDNAAYEILSRLNR